jgi:voltage-gated potassium channel
MKYMPSQLMVFFQNKTTRRNFITLTKVWVLLVVIVTAYSVLFHLIMLYEGRDFSWITGVYWSLTVMSTLGFGDITFSTDLGLLFTLLVLISGVIFLLIILPFTFIQFFYAPWLEAQSKARTPSELPENTHGHVIIAGLDPVSDRLVEHLKKKKFPYVILASDLHAALELHDAGYEVVVGSLDDPETYEKVRVKRAAMVVATGDDLINTNISFTVREITNSVPIVTNADKVHSLDILQFPGNMHVFQFMKMLGEALAKRTLGVSRSTSIIGGYDELLLAVAPAIRTPFEGRKLFDSRIREVTGLTVVGLWEKRKLLIPSPETVVQATTILVLAGSASQLQKFDETYARPRESHGDDAPVLILGGGRVGHAAAVTLDEHNIRYKIVEKRPNLARQSDIYIEGDAADLDTLKRAGIDTARSVITTTHNDDMNIYLTFYCRQLRPDVQIISRATMARNVSKLHRAGADLVISYAAMGASAILDILVPGEVSLFAEGLKVFDSHMPSTIIGKTLAESRIREKTGCNVVALKSKENLLVSPDPMTPLLIDTELILVGTDEAEKRFLAFCQS